jgi:hypothetical protein
MDLRTPRSRTAGTRALKIRDVDVVHILALDGTVATIRRKRTKRSDDNFQLTVQGRDRQATRRIAAGVARDPESAEFARVVAEMKTRLLGPSPRRPAH